MKSDATWLFDLGNTRLKAAWWRAGDLSQSFSLEWGDAQTGSDFDSALQAHLAAWPAPQRVLIASVVSIARAKRLRDALQLWPQANVCWLRSPRSGCGVKNRYRVPGRLGIDRFLAMAAARAASGNAPAAVIGCGTALTLDALDADGVQQEGLIAPSPGLMLRSLREATAIDEANPQAFASGESDDTARALRQGCERAGAALVEWYCARHRSRFGELHLWLHGGAAAELRAALQGETAARAKVLDDAVLRGLALWAESGESGQVKAQGSRT